MTIIDRKVLLEDILATCMTSPGGYICTEADIRRRAASAGIQLDEGRIARVRRKWEAWLEYIGRPDAKVYWLETSKIR